MAGPFPATDGTASDVTLQSASSSQTIAMRQTRLPLSCRCFTTRKPMVGRWLLDRYSMRGVMSQRAEEAAMSGTDPLWRSAGLEAIATPKMQSLQNRDLLELKAIFRSLHNVLRLWVGAIVPASV